MEDPGDDRHPESPLISVSRGWSMMVPPLVYPPLVVVLQDGTRILPEVEKPNETLPKVRMGNLRFRVIDRAVAEIEVLSTVSLDGLEWARTDDGTTVVQLYGGETTRDRRTGDDHAPIRLEAYGLGRAESESGSARRALGFMIGSLLEGARNGEYSPAWLRITPTDDLSFGIAPIINESRAPLQWPGPPLLKVFPGNETRVGRSIGIGGSLFGTCCRPSEWAHLVSWTDGNTTMDLFTTILYPGELEDFRPTVMVDNWADLEWSSARTEVIGDSTPVLRRCGD